MKILVVDDDGMNRKVLRVKLEGEGHGVFEADDGVQALELLEREPVEGIISDVLMPRMDGYRFCLEVRKNPRLCILPFIIYTSTFTSPGDERLALEVGADDYLTKPATVRALLEALARTAAARRLAPSHIIHEQKELLLVREYSDLLVKKLEEKHRDLQLRAAQLQESAAQNRLLASIVESSNDAIISKLPDGTILSWNYGATRLYGYTAEEMIGKSISIIVPPDLLEEWRELMKRASRGECVSGIETTHARQDGSRVEVAIKLSPVKDDRGEILALSAIVSDITQRKALERELALREQRLQSFFTAATAGMAILDTDLRYLQINEALATANGLPVSAHLGRTVREVVPDLAPTLEPVFHKLLETGEPVLNYELEGETRAKPGVKRHWVASYFPIRIDSVKPEGMGAVVVEITEHKRAEADLRNSREQMRALAAHLQLVREEEQTRISREIHDELGQMLTGLKMDLRWAENKMARPLSSDGQQAIQQRITDAVKLADSTIETIQRIAADLRPSILDNFGLGAALEFEARRFEQRAGIRVKISAPKELPAVERDVATALFRICQETLTNVARHAKATTVEVRLHDDGRELVLEVEDDGRGIPDDAASRRTSLGLLGMYERVSLLGGHLSIHGRRVKGTIVSARIPRIGPDKSVKG